MLNSNHDSIFINNLNRKADGEGNAGIVEETILLGVQLCFRRFPINGFSGKWWSK